MEKAEIAVLRMTNDQYRKIIFNAQVYANTGAGTYAQAVDMAARDFLSAGINCIEYKNGRRVNIKSYAEMALRTAEKRAYLQGEGDKCKEWGISTVILNKRSNPCPLCAPFVGKVFIDDVWSGGSKDGISNVTGIKYPLLSEAIKQGLYHPNCRDSHTTYFEGISTPPSDSKYTADELDELAEKYKAKQKSKQASSQAERMERMSRFSLDPDNKRAYAVRAKQWRRTERGIKEGKAANKMAETKVDWSSAEPITHTKAECNEIERYAGERNIKIYGISKFDGDTEMLKAQLDTIRSILGEYRIKDRITVTFDKMSDDDFAQTISKTINFNTKALRDAKVTNDILNADNYLSSADFTGIAVHECGHIISGKYGEKGLEIAMQAYYNIYKKEISYSELLDFLKENISEYAATVSWNGINKPFKSKYYKETLPEILAKNVTASTVFTRECIRVLKEMFL